MQIRWDDMRIEKILSPEYRKALEEALYKIKGSSDINLFRKDLEGKLSAYIGTEYAFCVNSGTDALDIALRILDIGKGDSVIIPDVTYATVPLAVAQRNAKIILADINAETLNIDESLIEKKIRKDTKAIILSHMFGRCSDLGKVVKIARKHKIFIIEDVCQAFASTYKGQKLGSFGDVSVFSFSFHKPISSCGGGGGMICFNNCTLKEKLDISLQNYFDDTKNDIYEKRFSKMYFFDIISLLVKVRYIEQILKSRQKIKNLYQEHLDKIETIQIFEDKAQSESVPGLNYTVFAENRDGLIDFLKTNDVECVPWHYPSSVISKLKLFKKFSRGKYPVSEDYYKKALCLPLFSFMKEEEAMYVIETIKKFYM